MKKNLLFISLLFVFSYLNALDLVYYFNVRDSLRIGATGAPYASYSSETGAGLGVNLLFFEDTENLYRHPFSARIDTYFSQKEREVSLRSSFPVSNVIYMNIGVKYLTKPQTFFGVGPNTDIENEYETDKKIYSLKGDLNHHIFEKSSVGLAFDFSGYKNESLFEQINMVEEFKYSGYDRFYRVLGFGTKIVYDSKNEKYFPSSGMYYKNVFMLYDKRLISDYNFFTLSQELNFYTSIKQHIFAYQIVSENTFKDRPFNYLTEQGSASMMRGFKTGRFLENNFIGFQAEYRSPVIFWRVSSVLFAGIGNSYKTTSDFNKENINLTAGFGFRFAVDKDKRLNLRADLGFSNEGKQIYLKFGEAF